MTTPSPSPYPARFTNTRVRAEDGALTMGDCTVANNNRNSRAPQKAPILALPSPSSPISACAWAIASIVRVSLALFISGLSIHLREPNRACGLFSAPPTCTRHTACGCASALRTAARAASFAMSRRATMLARSASSERARSRLTSVTAGMAAPLGGSASVDRNSPRRADRKGR